METNAHAFKSLVSCEQKVPVQSAGVVAKNTTKSILELIMKEHDKNIWYQINFRVVQI